MSNKKNSNLKDDTQSLLQNVTSYFENQKNKINLHINNSVKNIISFVVLLEQQINDKRDLIKDFNGEVEISNQKEWELVQQMKQIINLYQPCETTGNVTVQPIIKSNVQSTVEKNNFHNQQLLDQQSMIDDLMEYENQEQLELEEKMAKARKDLQEQENLNFDTNAYMKKIEREDNVSAADHSNKEGINVSAADHSNKEGINVNAADHSNKEGINVNAADHSNKEGINVSAADHSNKEKNPNLASKAKTEKKTDKKVSFKDAKVTESNSKKTITVNKTDEPKVKDSSTLKLIKQLEDAPTITPLLRFTKSERDALTQQLYLQAKNKVEKQKLKLPQDQIEKKIFTEADKLLEKWKEEHKDERRYDLIND